MKINDIKNILQSTPEADLPAIIAGLESDLREGVKKLVISYKKRHNNYIAENERLDGLLYFERRYERYARICGVDEAGAGPLAGPVAAAAVILPVGLKIRGLDDSKKLSAVLREELFDEIVEKAVDYCIATVEADKIDAMNILEARLLAMSKAVGSINADFALIDGDRAPRLAIPYAMITGGDACCMSIAAASVLAKVYRDRLMSEYDKEYPNYGFAKHKGYGTAEHLSAIRTYGSCPIHRKTFLRRH